mgnify:CR=1 FL=1
MFEVHRSSEEETIPSSPCSRRAFLRTALVAAGGLTATTPVSEGFSLFGRRSQLDLSIFPRTWIRRTSERDLHSYAKYLSSLQLKHIGVEQVLLAHARNKGSLWNSLPPRRYWRNMAQTLWVADEIADRLGGSIKQVTSAYRSPSYNARCPGAKPNSYHKQNYALDLQFYASPWTVYRIARSIRQEGHFQGGIGRYPGFTHVDTRGYNTTW